MACIKLIQPRRSGFTLVEVTIVVVVIGILVGITTVSYVAVTNNAKQQTAMTDAQAAGSALTKYKADHGKYPNALADVGTIRNVKSTYAYAYDPIADTYCVTATNAGFNAYVKNTSIKATQGTCP